MAAAAAEAKFDAENRVGVSVLLDVDDFAVAVEAADGDNDSPVEVAGEDKWFGLSILSFSVLVFRSLKALTTAANLSIYSINI